MDILKHGSIEKGLKYDSSHGGILYFRCDRCGCEFSAKQSEGEIKTRQVDYNGDVEHGAKCPECDFQTWTSFSYYYQLEDTRMTETEMEV